MAPSMSADKFDTGELVAGGQAVVEVCAPVTRQSAMTQRETYPNRTSSDMCELTPLLCVKSSLVADDQVGARISLAAKLTAVWFVLCV